MNYNKLYTRFIESRSQPIGYFEEHHILPRSLGGDNKPENLINLTAREHFIAHRILAKCFTGSKKRAMIYALNMFRNVDNKKDYQKYQITSRTYEYIKKEYIKVLTHRMNLPSTIKRIREQNKKLWASPEFRKKMKHRQKERMKELMSDTEWKKEFIARRRTPEYRKLMSKLAKKRNKNPEYRKKIAESKTLKLTGTPFKPKYNLQPTWGNHKKDLPNRRLCSRCGTNYTHSNGYNSQGDLKFRPRCHSCDVELGRRKVKSLIFEKGMIPYYS